LFVCLVLLSFTFAPRHRSPEWQSEASKRSASDGFSDGPPFLRMNKHRLLRSTLSSIGLGGLEHMKRVYQNSTHKLVKGFPSNFLFQSVVW